MKTHRLSYEPTDAWSGAFPDVDGDQTLVLFFADYHFFDAPEPIHELTAAFPHSLVAGCSSGGEISNNGVADESIQCVIVEFASSRLRMVTTPTRTNSSMDSGQIIGEALSDDDLKGVLILAEGDRINGSRFADGLTKSLPQGVTIGGGLSADALTGFGPWVYANGELLRGFSIGIGFYGDSLQVGWGCEGGWQMFGPERLVTRSEGTTLIELDGQPALDLYRKYLGDLADEMPSAGLLFPLLVKEDRDQPGVVRTILSMDEESCALTFAGEIPEGATAQLMQGSFDVLIDGAENAAASAAEMFDPQLVVIASCVGRRLVLGDDTAEEVAAARHAFPTADLIGFYTHGELAPTGLSASCELHNQTMTLLTIAEAR